MAEVYGEIVAQGLDDPPWITDATAMGHLILTKDFNSLRYEEPFQTVQSVRARVFALSNAQLLGPQQLQCFLDNKARILRVARLPGPYIYKVYRDHIVRAWP